jgi:diadenosine tetraphosphate (Ap4A) HIT family hydrolase
VVPKFHCRRLSDLPEEYASALGVAVTKLAKALTKGDERHHLLPLEVDMIKHVLI